MRKIYSLIALFLMAIVANAQVISFTEADVAAKGELSGNKTFSNGDFSLTTTDNVDGGKLVIDASNALFGTLEDYVKFTHRLKTGGKSTSTNCMSLSVPTAGTLKVYARTGSKDSERPVILTQGETEIFNQKFLDSQAATEQYTDETGAEKTRTVFPVYSCEVEAGTVNITYPDNAVNFYAFELVAAAPAAPSSYEATITSDPENVYYSGYQAFDMQQVISALGLADEAALAALVSAGGNVYLKDATGALTNTYTGNTNEFWMNIDGTPQGYGDEGTCWYAGLYYDEAGTDAETGEAYPSEFYCKVGQMPDFFKAVYTPSTLNVVLVLKNGDKEAEFAITLNVNAAKVPETIAEPVTSLANVNVVKEYTTTIDFTYGKEYENKTISVDMSDIAEALGCSMSALADNIEKVTLTEKMNSTTNEETQETSNTPSGELDTPANLAGGAWFGRYSNYDETSGATTTYTQNYSHNWGANSTFYVQSIKLEDGTFSFSTGQYMKTMETGSQDYAVLYILNGDKAAKLTINVNVTAPEVIPFEQMEKAGEQTIDITSAVEGWVVKDVTVDMEAVATALGCTVADIDNYYTFTEDGTISDNHTQGTGFFWTVNGTLTNWSSSSENDVLYSLLPTANKYDIQQFAQTSYFENKGTEMTEDITVTVHELFLYSNKYYDVIFNYTVKAPAQPSEDFKLTEKGKENLSMQIVPNNENIWAWEKTASIDLDYVKGLIGTEDFVLYTDKATTAEDGTVTIEMSKKWSCDPKPGFWYGDKTYTNEEGQVIVENAGWGSNSFGLSYASGIITFYQYPGQRSVGDAYTANLYLVNEETGDYLKYIINVTFVETASADVETVGTEEVTVEAKEATADGTYKFTLDSSKALEALGLEAANIEEAQIIAPASQYTVANVNPEEEITFDANGYVSSDESKIVSMAALTFDNGTPVITIDPMEVDLDAADATSIVVRVGLEYNGKRYIYVITVGNAAYTSINSVNASTTASAIYTVGGAKVNALQKGINIVKMANGSVQKVYVK